MARARRLLAGKSALHACEAAIERVTLTQLTVIETRHAARSAGPEMHLVHVVKKTLCIKVCSSRVYGVRARGHWDKKRTDGSSSHQEKQEEG